MQDLNIKYYYLLIFHVTYFTLEYKINSQYKSAIHNKKLQQNNFYLQTINIYIQNMYRKSVDYSQNSIIHIMDFSSFKKKSQQTTQFLIDSIADNQFRIKKSNNTMITIIVIADILVQIKTKNKRTQEKIFKDFNIDNIPKNQYNYQNQNTLEQIWAILNHRLKSLQNVQDCLVNYTITEFIFLCFGRKVIKDYMDQFKQKLDLHGNQNELLLDYNAELRGKFLHILGLALKIDVCIIHRDLSNQLEESFFQYFGDSRSLNRVQINDIGQFYKVSIFIEEEAKLSAANSSQNIIFTGRKKDKQSLDTTIQKLSTRQPESRSSNKESLKCVKCIAKGKICECERSNKKITTRQAVNNINPVTTKSIDGINGSGFKRQISSQEINVGGFKN